MTDHKITAELIQKFLNGSCTLEEKARVILWYSHFDEERDVMEDISAEQREQLKRLMLGRINSRIDALEPEERPAPKVRSLTYWLSGVAAAILLIFGISLFRESRPTGDAINQNIREAKLLVLENQGNTLYERKLEDGTVIWLSPGARIEVPEHFAENSREVSMSGKVFFEVAKNPKRPFLIYAGGVTTRVLGTSFLVNAEKGENTEVSVVTGKVSVTVDDAKEEQVLLLPEQKGVFNTSESRLVKETLPEKSEVEMWKKQKMSFDNVEIAEVTAVLASNFNVTINTNERMRSCLLKADFSDQNLANILEMLCKSVDASYEIKGDTITIKGKGCAN